MKTVQEILTNTTSNFILLKIFHKNTKCYKWALMERCGNSTSFAIINGHFSYDFIQIADIIDYQELPNIEGENDTERKRSITNRSMQ